MDSIIISRLIEAGYRVHIPLHRTHVIIVQTPSGDLKTCELQNASQDQDRAPIARGLKDSRVDLLGVVDGLTKTVWVIPKDAFEGRHSLRLGERYEEYIIPEPFSLSYKDQKKKRKETLGMLKDAAREMGEKFDEQKDGS